MAKPHLHAFRHSHVRGRHMPSEAERADLADELFKVLAPEGDEGLLRLACAQVYPVSA